ncbi:MAG: hypothetical protein ABFD82_15340 [Syntrophaceae bacterium]
MVYTFTCPQPCFRVTMVDAHHDDDAVDKFIRAGVIGCRYREKQSCRGKDYRHMSPLSEEQIREIVRLSMEIKHVMNV